MSEIDQNTFIAALNFVAPAMAKNDVRYFLNGVCFDAGPEQTTLVATNGHVLAAIEAELSLPEGQYIVSRDSVEKLLKIIKKSKIPTVVKIEVKNDQMAFTTDDLLISFKLLDGKYPDWRSVFKNLSRKHYKDEVGLNANYLAMAAKCAKGLSTSWNAIKMKVVSPNEAIYMEVPNPDRCNARMAIMPMKL